jgi:hypothetical protein
MAKPIKRQTWNNLDVFGLLNGLTIWDDQYKSLQYVRKPFEDSLDIKDRIFRGHDNLPDVHKQGLLNALSSEFELPSYNVLKKSIFQLSYQPIPSGSSNTQDISGYYKDSSGNWLSIGPQVWSDSYHTAKQDKVGFLVWQNERFNSIPGHKNFSYSNIVEVFREFDDLTELKFEYYVAGKDEFDNLTLLRYTDMNTPTDINDVRYTYRKEKTDLNLSGEAIVYTLDDIPAVIRSGYYFYDNGVARSYLYDIKSYIDKKYNFTWDKIRDSNCIWDINKSYGSGHIPSFYDAIVPQTSHKCRLNFSGYEGGIESLAYTLYPEKIEEQDTISNSWYLKVYPGKFYIDGYSFYLFENPQVSYIDLNLITAGTLSGYMSGIIPAGVSRGNYTIMAKSGYYNDYCNTTKDIYLTGVYEDYNYKVGTDGNKIWSNVYGRSPYLTSSMGVDFDLNIGKYCLDFSSNRVYLNAPSGFNQAVMVWDNVLVPTGTYITYDINPLNGQSLSLDKYFMYLSLYPNV